MSLFDRVPDSVLDTAWQQSCGGLVGQSRRNATISEVITGFAAPLQAAQLTRHEGHPPTFSLPLDTGKDVPADCLGAIEVKPLMILSILEFAKSVVEWKKTRGAEVPIVQCVPVGQPLSRIDQLGALQLGRLVCVKGTIVRISCPRAVCVSMMFVCQSCSAKKRVAVNGPLEYPSFCQGKCRGYKWSPVPADAECREIQILQIQAPMVADSVERPGGALHRTLEVELTGHLVDQVGPGELVCICGILSSRKPMDRRTAAAQVLLLQARSVTTLSGPGLQLSTQDETGASQEEAKYFRQRALVDPDGWFRCLTNSICPQIFAMKDVKQAMLMCLLGGTPKPDMRHNIHFLMVGDPGMGKSQLLRAACSIAPRSVYVAANVSSSCGLTVSLSRDSVTGEASFEAGAVVHGDGGITCIDEIDKGAAYHKSLLEVMEQQSLSMAKAGMVFSMPVLTSIMAAGNPIGGRYNPQRSIGDNINLSSALLSRFDFVWLLQDTARGLQDSELTRHVLNIHKGDDSQFNALSVADDTVAPAQFARFITFARQTCFPALSPVAAALLKDAYVARRRHTQESSVTARFLQSMIRAAEARAKVELRDTVTEGDALYAIELLECCARSAAKAGTGATPRGPAGKKNARDTVIDRMRETGRAIFSHNEILDIISECNVRNPDAMLDQLNQFGLILQHKGNEYRLAR